jgi:hypothetical protein
MLFCYIKRRRVFGDRLGLIKRSNGFLIRRVDCVAVAVPQIHLCARTIDVIVGCRLLLAYLQQAVWYQATLLLPRFLSRTLPCIG